MVSATVNEMGGPSNVDGPISQYLGHSVDQRNRRWKLYIEFCPYGNLGNMHFDLLDSGRTLFPEAFCWYGRC